MQPLVLISSWKKKKIQPFAEQFAQRLSFLDDHQRKRMATIQAQLAKVAGLDDQRKKIDSLKQILASLISTKNINDLKVLIEACTWIIFNRFL